MDFILKSPISFKNCCIEYINDDIRSENKRIRQQEAQKVINKMKGR